MEQALWKQNFRPRVLLEGGMDWWSGRVGALRESGCDVEADVRDRYPRHVRVRLEDGALVSCACSCPEGRFCRHVAAVCLAREEELLRREQETRYRNAVQRADQAYADAKADYDRRRSVYEEAKAKAEEEGRRRAEELDRKATAEGAPIPKKQLEKIRNVPVGVERPVEPRRTVPVRAPELRSVVAEMSEAELRASLGELAMRNPEVLEWLARRRDQSVPAETVRTWKEQIGKAAADNISIWLKDREQGARRIRGMCATISDCVNRLLENGQALDAFGLVLSLWSAVNTVEKRRGTVQGETPDLEDYCCGQWVRIADRGTEEEQAAMLEWLDESQDMTGCMERVILDGAWNRTILQERLERAERRMAFLRRRVSVRELLDNARAVGTGKVLKSNMAPIWLVPEMLSIQTRLGNRERVEALLREYHVLPSVRRWEIRQALQNRDMERYVALLEESLTLDAGFPALESLCASRLIRVYEELGRPDDCRRVCRFRIFSFDDWGMETVKSLKNVTAPADWPQEFERILALPGAARLRIPLLAMEKQYERLWKELMEHGTMEEMDACEEALKAWDPNRCREAYREVLERTALDTRSPAGYAMLVDRLMKLRAMEGGRSAAREVANSWMDIYSHRRELIRELRDLGM